MSYPARAESTGNPGQSSASRLRVAELSRQAVDSIIHGQLADAERQLLDALSIAPDNTTCLYNLAAVRAGQGRAADALAALERATEAGFTDFSQIESNPAFDRMRNVPGYRNLFARRGQITHRAAGRILAELRSRFGDSYHYSVDEPHKLVFAAHADPDTTADLQTSVLRQMQALEGSLFSHPPDEFVRVVVASAADFAKDEYRSDAGGHYDDTTRTVLVKKIGPELRHEFTHALHAADQHALGQEHPVWLSEGLATLYENTKPTIAADGTLRLAPADTWRLGNVQAAARRDTLIPLENLFQLDREAFMARADLAYGESASVLHFLDDQHLLKRFYDRYTAGYTKDLAGSAAFKEVTGLNLNELQSRWKLWLQARPAPARNSGIADH